MKAGSSVTAEQGVQMSIGVNPDDRCEVVIVFVALSVDRIIVAGEEHVRLAKRSSGEIVAVDERVSIFAAPNEEHASAKLNRLRVHAVVVQHFQRTVSGKGQRRRCFGCHGKAFSKKQ